MFPNAKPDVYHALYIVIPTVSIIGNGLIVYVTVRSRALRSPCSILIGLLSLSDMVLVSSHLIATAFHNIVQKELIPLSTCVYLLTFPLFATCASPMLLLNIAFDRLLSLMDFYKSLMTSYSKLYLMIQLIPATAFGMLFVGWVLSSRRQEEDVMCFLATPLQGQIIQVFVKFAMAICVLTMSCYACFLFFLRRIRLSSEKVKSIYRSLFVISLTVVLGYFSTSFILFVTAALHLNIEMFYLNQFAGLFVNLATSVNFFVYYAIRLYRVSQNLRRPPWHWTT
uniref:G_PROTEIN_RECEP_F1_2 domain-containing protein n=1 Tax=Haemonchus contortus TaxID=6289 RepID=A0A7I4YPY6_HAECO